MKKKSVKTSKPAKKPRAKKETRPLELGELPWETSFWLCDGQVIRCYGDLPSHLKKMKKDVFKHHVNKEKNDFANWIRDIIGDELVANKLMKARTKKDCLTLVDTRLKRIR